MKRILLLSIIVLFIFQLILSCNENRTESCNDKVRQTESNEISKVVVQFLEEKRLNFNLPICNSLERLNIIAEDINKISSEVSLKKLDLKAPRELYVQKLLLVKLNKKFFFKKSDSLNFVNQNCKSQFKFSKLVLKNVKIVDIKKIKNNSINKYIKFTYPIFSSDNEKAYVEIDFYKKENQFGNSLYLKKTNNKWKIVDIQGLWNI